MFFQKLLKPPLTLISAVALFLWMGVIFFFSSLSGVPTDFAPATWYIIERKSAHVFEYAVLTFLAFSFFSRVFKKESLPKVIFLAAVFSFMYGATDELHQFFVPYRGAKITDVLVDVLGIILTTTFLFWREKRK